MSRLSAELFSSALFCGIASCRMISLIGISPRQINAVLKLFLALFQSISASSIEAQLPTVTI